MLGGLHRVDRAGSSDTDFEDAKVFNETRVPCERLLHMSGSVNVPPKLALSSRGDLFKTKMMDRHQEEYLTYMTSTNVLSENSSTALTDSAETGSE